MSDLLTPEELADIKATNDATIQPDKLQRRLIATIEAAWAENERLRKALAAKTARPQDQALS